MDITNKIKTVFAPFTDTKSTTMFVVYDKDIVFKAGKALLTVGAVVSPNFPMLKMAYDADAAIVNKFLSPLVEVIEKKRMTFEQAYLENVKYFQGLLDQCNALIEIIEKMINPLLYNQADLTMKQEQYYRTLFEYEERIRIIEKMMAEVYGKSPSTPKRTKGKQVWSTSLKLAADYIIKNYEVESKAAIKNYRSLRDASDEFYDCHIFTYKADLTKDQLYENVKKANLPWLGKRG